MGKPDKDQRKFPLFGRVKVFVGDFIMIDEDGYAYPCPFDLIEKRGGRIFVAMESVDNSNGKCGDKEVRVIHEDDKVHIDLETIQKI